MTNNYRKKEDYIVITAADGTELTRDIVEGRILTFKRGLSPATIHIGPNQNRSYEAALKHRAYLAETDQIQIAHPRFGDETRPSFDRAVIDGSELQVHVGLTSYPAFMVDLQRGRSAPELNLKIQERGVSDFKDRWAYFQQAVGAMGLVVTSDGSVVIGRRKSTGHEYDGFFDSAAGYVLFPANVEHPELLDPASDAKRLIQREFGIEPGAITSVVQAGFHGHPNTGEFDIAHIVRVDVDDSHFAQGRYPETAKRNLADLVLINGFDNVQKVLTGEHMGNEHFMYSTWGALLSLKPEDFNG